MQFFQMKEHHSRSDSFPFLRQTGTSAQWRPGSRQWQCHCALANNSIQEWRDRCKSKGAADLEKGFQNEMHCGPAVTNGLAL